MILAVNRADLAEMSFYAVLRSVRVHPSQVEPIIPTLKELHTCGIAAQTCLRTNFVLPKVEHYDRAVLRTAAGRKFKFPKLPRSRSYPILPY